MKCLPLAFFAMFWWCDPRSERKQHWHQLSLCTVNAARCLWSTRLESMDIWWLSPLRTTDFFWYGQLDVNKIVPLMSRVSWRWLGCSFVAGLLWMSTSKNTLPSYLFNRIIFDFRTIKCFHGQFAVSRRTPNDLVSVGYVSFLSQVHFAPPIYLIGSVSIFGPLNFFTVNSRFAEERQMTWFRRPLFFWEWNRSRSTNRESWLVDS